MMKHGSIRCWMLVGLTAVAMVGFSTARAAELRLAPAFSDGAVLQRGRPIVVWGEADPNAAIEVTFGDARQSVKADFDGKWRLALTPLDASATPRTLAASSGGKEVVVKDVLVGDVWLCSGQSNMQMTLRETKGGIAAAEEAAKLPLVRLLTIPKKPAPKPLSTFDATWQPCAKDAAEKFAAVGLYFGLELRRDPALANVPIGLIDGSFGGSAAEAWISAEELKAFPPGDVLPSMFAGPSQHFNGMVAPLLPFPVAGVLWYQGESNGARPDLYPRMLETMIRDWRTRWNDPALPFLIVQLPPYTDSHFTWIREAQAAVVTDTPGTALAVTIDTTDGYDLHPKEKQEIGRRLGLLARKLVYKEELIAQGPTFKTATVDGSTIRVTFGTAGDGLVNARGAGALVKGFALAGEDDVYHFADGTIDGDAVIVRSADVPSPKTVRYAWAGIPEVGLANKSGLPAVPFRTDTFAASLADVQKRSTAYRMSVPAYEVEVSGDGRVTSLGVRGKQFVSNAFGNDGGATFPSFFGPRGLQDVRPLGPNLLSCSDNDVTLLLSFRDDSMDWTVVNRAKSGFQFRVALAAKVTVATDAPSGRMELTRGPSSISVTGVDSVSDGDDGKVLEVKVEGGQTKRLTWQVAGK